ncbi:MAG: peptidoglycan DD-metalloendopeptidase family protein [Succinivibrio sp.]|jgi:murein DD-endopeptidase MepM/ murein hydrolase activator NlpD|nr:peptidoglycan DD-metalloendopeptidase family protein [Succinivibrio sp.]
MKFEDYISSDILGNGRWQRPLPWKHTCAAGITLTAAVVLSLLSPKAPAPALSAAQDPDYAASRNSWEDPAADLSTPLTALFGAPEDNASASMVSADHRGEALDNYDDTLPESAFADSDDALDAQVRDLAARDAGGKAEVELKWYEEDVQKGDTISSIFSDLNIPAAVTMAILDNKQVASEVDSVKLGEHLSFLLDDQSRLMAFVKPYGADQQIRFYRNDPQKNAFSYVIEKRGSHLKDSEETVTVAPVQTAQSAPAGEKAAAPAAPEKKQSARETRGRLVLVTIGKGETFSEAANKAGISYAEINQILNMFKGRIQFSRNVRPGDTMRVLFTDSKGKGKISAVEFSLHGNSVYAFLNQKDGKFYDEKGLNSKSSKGLRRFPFNITAKVTSPFNPARRHPVTGVVRPHLGTDFGMPVGTPIIAPADGVVVTASFTRSTGYYVVLRHRGAYSTVYMHLSRISVKPGQSVKAGAVIARSGNTGLSTGPHLHYELRINGRPVNAMRVKLNNIQDSVAAQDRKRFAANIASYKKELHNSKLIAKR